MAASTGDLDNEFDLPTEVESIKESVLSGRSWSANLHEQFVPPVDDIVGGDHDNIEDEGFDDISNTPLDSKSFQMITSSSRSVRRPVIRAPSTHRDLTFLLAFIAQWVLTVVMFNSSASPLNKRTNKLLRVESRAWSSLLVSAILIGTSLGVLCLLLLMFDISRYSLIRIAQPLAVSLQLALLTVLLVESFTNGDALAWGFSVALFSSILFMIREVQRTRDRINFLVVLVEMIHEIFWKYQAFYGVVATFLSVQVLYLVWWASALESVLRSGLSATSTVALLMLLLLNIYWSTQALRLSLVVVAVGILTHYFANAYPSEEYVENGEGASGDHSENDDLGGEAGLLSTVSPLLFDGALLPPMLPADSEQAGVGHTDSYDMSGGWGRSEAGRGVANARPELADGESHFVVAHFLRCALTTSLGTVCRAALACFPVRAAELLLHALGDPPGIEWCEENCENVVRGHHELLLVHVAAYSKSFTSAARDVWALIDESGLQSVQEEDVAGAVVHSICTGVGAIVATSVATINWIEGVHTTGSTLGWPWSLLTLTAFALAYVGSALSLKIVDSAVTAIYVVFAEHPVSLRALFPLVHHRFSRLAEF